MKRNKTTRILKVYYLNNRPYIRLSGKWLEESGFNIGSKIKVQLKDKVLVIEPKKEDI